ncbi:fumarylacetoacetate hydrolase family protein [Neobacillus sp. OS1-33]|jgi:2-keto-4-pentenoate hydratase/2-oxohepta-3-ene-1,7-dioic acid hydratase in catechol pathway|uniref:fumarylacetoacetate hydrolase family protein n=1 Tax=Neobacillus sp. OS1-33 TaxID=3070683 RepID=UPI0027E0EE0F|nr:fumarylacetoacetate hydrolase family protein [Neobacillus sp. OS1-33]WML27423.1 fumarylacetoacetate hydrolase family protein [Neobacillus sp. OS1-33]
MGIKVVRFEHKQKEQWGVVSGEQIHLLSGTYQSLADFLEHGKDEARAINKQKNTEFVPLNEVTILSPVTKPARIVCQGVNYSEHRSETGMDAARAPFNLIFSKADSSLCGATSEIVRPSGVKLLDYELELGLVIGTEISEASDITDENLHQYIAGLVIVNDVSARDVQLSEGQWLKGKSYRTFCPTGPYFYLLEKEELPLIHDLELNLWVNDELRQSANSNQLLYKPAETLTELSGIMDFSPGDLIVTGTAGGVALSLTPQVLELLSNMAIPYQQKLDLLEKGQLISGKYLKDGDVIRCQIKSANGVIDLGEQMSKVVPSKGKTLVNS